MNRDTGDGRILRRHTPMLEIASALFRSCEVMVAGLIDPQAMGLEIRRGSHLGQAKPAFLTKRRDDFRGQEMSVDHKVPGSLVEQTHKVAQIDLLQRQPQPIAAMPAGAAWLI